MHLLISECGFDSFRARVRGFNPCLAVLLEWESIALNGTLSRCSVRSRAGDKRRSPMPRRSRSSTRHLWMKLDAPKTLMPETHHMCMFNLSLCLTLRTSMKKGEQTCSQLFHSCYWLLRSFSSPQCPGVVRIPIICSSWNTICKKKPSRKVSRRAGEIWGRDRDCVRRQIDNSSSER